jgi:hypothetical protein
MVQPFFAEGKTIHALKSKKTPFRLPGKKIFYAKKHTLTPLQKII